MDPDANLQEQRQIAQRILERFDQVHPDTGEYTAQAQIDQLQDAERLAELVQALDGWITSAGFMPAAWRKHNRR